MSLNGLDSGYNCEIIAKDIKNAGYDFIMRYYNVKDPSKNLTYEELHALSNEGLSVGVVWENGYSNSVSCFSYDQGKEDGKNAGYYASRTIGQPEGTPIFFGVDYDASVSDISGAIADYFRGVREAVEMDQYPIGVYGSGTLCEYILNNGLAEFSWLSRSTGWSGYNTFTSWDIKQGGDITIAGVPFDADTCTNISDPFIF